MDIKSDIESLKKLRELKINEVKELYQKKQFILYELQQILATKQSIGSETDLKNTHGA